MSKKENPLINESKQIEEKYKQVSENYRTSFEELNTQRDKCRALVDDCISLLESIKKAPIFYSRNLNKEIKKIKKDEEIYQTEYIKQKNKQKELYFDIGALAIGGGVIFTFRNYLEDYFDKKDKKIMAAIIMAIFFVFFFICYLFKKFFNSQTNIELIRHIETLNKEIILLDNLETLCQISQDELEKIYNNTKIEYEYLKQFESYEFKNIDNDSKERFKTLINTIQFIIQKLKESIEDLES